MCYLTRKTKHVFPMEYSNTNYIDCSKFIPFQETVSTLESGPLDGEFVKGGSTVCRHYAIAIEILSTYLTHTDSYCGTHWSTFGGDVSNQTFDSGHTIFGMSCLLQPEESNEA